MAVDTLLDRLKKYFTAPDRFALPAANDLGSADIDATIKAYLPDDTLVITDGTAPQGTDRVTWSGKAVLARGQKDPYAVDVVFEERADGGDTRVQFVVSTIALGDAWSFVTSFPSLDKSAVASARFTAPQLTLSSARRDAAPAVDAGLTFGG